MINVQEVYNPLYENKDKFITLITGGRGSGKSFNTMTFIERLTFEQGHKILLTRYTMTSASISVIPEFREKVELDGTQQYFNITEKDATNLATDSVVMFRGIKTSSGNQTANLKSIQGLTTFVVDEGEEWISEEEYDKLMLSIRQKGIQNRIIIIMNPTNVNHFVYRKYIRDTHETMNIDGIDVQISTHPNVLHIHTTYLDNINNLSADFMDAIAEMKEKDAKNGTKKYAHQVIGRWSELSEDAIFTNWGVCDEIPYYAKKRGFGVDYGYTHPTAIVECAIHEDILYVREVLYKTRMNPSETATELKKIRGKIISESALPSYVDEFKNAGINIHAVNKGKKDGVNSVLAGIRKMQDFKIMVVKGSDNIIDELNEYRWSRDKDNVLQEDPIREKDHAIDAIRYWILEEVLGNNRKGFTAEFLRTGINR